MGHERTAQRLRALVTGADGLMMWGSSPSKTVFEHHTEFEACASPKHSYCNDGFLALRAKLGKGLLDGKYALPALLVVTHSDLSKGCSSCKDWYMDLGRNKVQEIWENILADFDLPAINAKLYSTSSINSLYCKFYEWPISDSVI